jgi:hypothetical protein
MRISSAKLVGFVNPAENEWLAKPGRPAIYKEREAA